MAPRQVEPRKQEQRLLILKLWFYRRPDMSDQEFAEDAKAAEKDLAKLKTLLEK